ncbi:hypothetical protein OC846_000179 [Tilletia horrida]|uniref:Uncharacterized protein n=1 Tax=Tilletia horrida TaxID=155126 RepID=A0AAN6JUS7_9BASI|nr:hypothetical protein OC845_000453 [Tilletia horrida]KAK0557884.1 hypothetical protein OC846_000179 [Tilletia horrida]
MEHPGYDLLHRRAHRTLNEARMVRAIVARSPLLNLNDPFGTGGKDTSSASGTSPSSTVKTADDTPVSVPPVSIGVNTGGAGKDPSSTDKPPVAAGGSAGSTSKTDGGDIGTAPKTGGKATNPPAGTGTANDTGAKIDPSAGSTGAPPSSGGAGTSPDFDMPAPSGGIGAGSSPGYVMPAPSGGIGAGTNPGSSPSTTPPSGSSPANHTTGTAPNASEPPPTTTTPAAGNSTSAANSTSTHPSAAPAPASTPAGVANATATNTTTTPTATKPKGSATNTTLPKNGTESTPQVIQIIQSTPAPTPNATIDSGPPTDGSTNSSENGTGIGVIIGGIAGGLAGVIILIWLILIPVRRRQARQKDVDWAMAFDNDKDHGPSENSADVIYGLQASRGLEKNDAHNTESVVMGDVNRSQSDAYAHSEAARQAYAQYSASDHHPGATQWVDPRGHAYSASQGQMYQDYAYDTQQQGAYFQPPNQAMSDPYGHLSPPQGPMAFYGHPDGMHGYNGAVSPPASSSTPLFPATVQRGPSMSSASSKSPSSGPLIHKNNSFSGGGASTLHEEYEGDATHEKLADDADPHDDLYGGVAAPVGHH